MSLKKIINLLWGFSLLLFLYSCGSSKSLDYSSIPVNSVFKGELKNNSHIYLIKKPQEQAFMSGSYFFHNKAVENIYSYSVDNSGNIVFYTDNSFYNGKIKADKKNNLTLSLPEIPGRQNEKQNVELISLGVLEEKNYPLRYKEKIHSGIKVKKDLEYSKANGFYTSYPIAQIPNRNLKNLSSQLLSALGQSTKNTKELSLSFNVYEPANDKLKNRPLILYVHGGAFYFGDKENTLQQVLADTFVEKGYVVISMNYRLGTNIREGTKAIEKAIYTGTQDVRSALRYIIKNKDGLGIDPQQIYLVGNSAGGIIALNTIFMDDDEIFLSVHKDWNNFGPLDPPGDKLDNQFRWAGVVSLWGAMADPSIIKNNPPVPTLLFHGTADDIVNPGKGLPYKNFFQEYLNHRVGNSITNFVNTFLLSEWTMHGSSNIYKQMNSLDFPVEYVEFPSYGHEPQENEDGSFNENMSIIQIKMDDFLNKNVINHYFNQVLVGNNIITRDSQTSSFQIVNAGDKKVDWEVEGGYITNQTPNTIQVVWFGNTPINKKVKAYITDENGITAKKELLILII